MVVPACGHHHVHPSGLHLKHLLAAETAAGLDPWNPQVLYKRGLCEDAVGLYQRSADSFAKAASLCTGSTGVHARLKQSCESGRKVALQHVAEQLHGEYQWDELYRADPPGLTSGKPAGGLESLVLPTASFCHRLCRVRLIPGKGRGLIVEGDMGRGELVFAQKAFVFDQKKNMLRAAVARLRSGTQAEADLFFCLYDGFNGGEAVPESLNIEGRPQKRESLREEVAAQELDVERIKRILSHNMHSRDSMSENGQPMSDDICGVWLLPSFMNHSCRANVEHVFVGDMMLCRTTRPLKAGSELYDTYISSTRPLQTRQGELSGECGIGYGFACTCARCRVEEVLLPVAKAKPLMDQLTRATAQINPSQLGQALDAFNALAQSVEKIVAEAVLSKARELEQDASLREACEELYGPPTREPAWLTTLYPLLEKLLCSSFLPVWIGIAFARNQLARSWMDHALAAKAYRRCCELYEEISTSSVSHANCSAQYVKHAYRAFKGSPRSRQKIAWRETKEAAQYARSCHAICYGGALWQAQTARLGWHPELTAAAGRAVPQGASRDCPREPTVAGAAAAASDPAAAEGAGAAEERRAAGGEGGVAEAAAAGEATWDPRRAKGAGPVPRQAPWRHAISVVAELLVLSVQLPVHADVGSVELDVSADCAELSLVAGAEAGSLRVPLPHRVDPSRAGPAKYHRTSSRLVLELPRAAHI